MKTKTARFIARLALGCASVGLCGTSASAGEFSANAGTTFVLVPLLSTGRLAAARGRTVLEGFAALAAAPGFVDFPGSTGIQPQDADLIAPPSGDFTGKACWVMEGNLVLPGRSDDLHD